MPRASLKQRKDGRYVAKYQGRQFYGATQSEAYSKRDAFKRQVEAGLRAEAGSIPLSEYAAQWVHAYKSAVSDRTFNNCVRVLNSLVSIVGDKPLKEVYPIDIQNALALQAGKSKSHIDHYKRTVSAMFQSAVHNRLILVSPCVSVSAPRGSSGSHRAIRKWERDLILQSDHRFTPAVMVMLYAGLRRGEALALNVDRDVDFKSKTITVREAVRFDSNQPIVSTPKTDAGLRTVPLPSILATVLRPVRGLIAPAADGRHMSETAFVRSMESYTAHLEQLLNGDTRRWYGRRKGQGEDWLEAHPWQSVSIRTHDLRHSYCTMLFDAGVDVKTAQKWMGHKDIATTMRIYTHLSAERESRSVRNFHAFMASDPVYGIQPGIQPSPPPLKPVHHKPFPFPQLLSTNQKVVGSNPAGLTSEKPLYHKRYRGFFICEQVAILLALHYLLHYRPISQPSLNGLEYPAEYPLTVALHPQKHAHRSAV